jgi:hypothetical protein
MYRKVLIDEGGEVSIEMRSDFVPALEIYAANEVNDAGFRLLVLRTRHSGSE